MMLERFTQHTVDPLALMSNVSPQQYSSQSSTTPQSTHVPPVTCQPHISDNMQLDSGLSPMDNLIENLTSILALLTQSYKTYLSQTNNQLRSSSNTRNQATVQDGKVVVQNVQGRQNKGHGSNTRGAGAAGHIARNSTQPKRPQNSDYFKDKMLLMQVQENGVVLDEEQLLFLAGGHDTAVDEDVDEPLVQDLALNVDNVFQADECDAFDSDVDEAHTAQTMFMECHPQIQFMMKPNKVVNASLTAELATYKEQVELYERRAKFELAEREQNIKEQLRIVITGRNIKEENLKKELHSLKMQLNSTINHNKSMDVLKMKAKALKEQTTGSRPIKSLTMYPPNTPVTLVPRVVPTKSQVKINIFALIQLLLKFEKPYKKRITPTGLTKGKRGFEQTKECYLTEVILFFKTLKEHFEGLQKALTKEIKEMKEIFEELEAEVDKNVVNRKYDAIERKNLLIANDNLIADCLSKEVFYIATNSELTVSRFTEMHDAHTVVQTRCLELEAELFKLNDKIQKDVSKKKQPRRKQRKETKIPQPSGSIEPITDEAANEAYVPTHSNDPLLNGEDRLQLKELLELCTKLSERVLDLENTKTSQTAEITKLKERVKKLERRNKSRTPGLKRLRKVGRSTQVVSFEDEGLGAREDASRQGRKIIDLDADAEEVEIEKVVSTTDVTTASATTTTVDELTLAQTLIEIKVAKPKAITIAATTTTTTVTRPKARGVKDQILIDEEIAQRLQAQLNAELEEEEKLAKQREEDANIAELDNVQAMIDADYELAARLQAQEQEEFIVEEISKLFLEQERIKKQKIDDDQEEAEIKKHIEIVVDEEEIAVDAISLATKPPIIVDWKIIKEGNMG
ncbi:hypothetical protein Tco_0563936 [Tanacetum coccineum]